MTASRALSAMRVLAALLLCLTPILPAAAQSDGTEISVPELSETLLGASNVSATTGNGRLTVGISPDGDVTVLSWPSPTHFDQLHYLTANRLDARARPRMGALEAMGMFAGLVVSTDGGATTTTTYLRDGAWRPHVAFTGPDTSVVVTTFAHDVLGLTVRQLDFVLREQDVLVRRYELTRAETSPVTDAWLLAYENLSPGLSRVPQVPVVEFLFDRRNDYLAVWDEAGRAVVHFHPGDTGVVETLGDALLRFTRDFGPLGELLAGETLDPGAVAEIAGALDAHYAPGVYAAVAVVPDADQVQVGQDATDTCGALDEWADGVRDVIAALPPEAQPSLDTTAADLVRCGGEDPVADVREDEGWTIAPEDALEDARDGSLGGNLLAGAQVNAALRAPIAFEGGQASAAMLVAFADTAGGARAALDAARSADLEDLQAAVEDADRAFVAGLVLPGSAIEEIRSFCVREALNLAVGRAADGGAIVASINRQPSYNMDWPRDGAFLNAALDRFGLSDWVTERIDFYASVVRTEPAEPIPLVNTPVPGWPDCAECTGYPADSWEMNYYSDGVVGANVRLEMDATALTIWSIAQHAAYVPVGERTAWLERHWPLIERVAAFMAGWRDPESGLVWPVNEEDGGEFTQGLQAAETTYAGLVAAARIGSALGHREQVDAWLHRAGELRSALLAHLWSPETGFDEGRVGGTYPGGPTAWLAWPTEVLPADDERLRDDLRQDLERAAAIVRGEGLGAAYLTRTALSAALVFREGPERELAREVIERLARDIADPDTRTIGEAFRNLDEDGDGVTDRQQSRVATPHLWSGALVCLTALALEDPEGFAIDDDVLPAVEVPEVPAPSEPLADAGVEPPDAGADAGPGGPTGGGCGCTTAAGPHGAAPLLLLLLARRRRIRGHETYLSRPPAQSLAFPN